MSTIATLLLLAVEEEGVPPEHIAADLAVPIAILIFCGSVYILLWAVYGARKGALIYSTAFFGFTFVLGVFWWFGAPGTPIAGGPQNFPGQPTGAYQPKWFAMEPGSERAGFFPATQRGFDAFLTPPQYLGIPPGTSQEDLERNIKLSALLGDLEQAADHMVEHYLPEDEGGGVRLGQNRRAAIMEAVGDPQPGERRADPFLTARVAPAEDGDPQIRVLDDAGHRVAAAKLQVVATFVQQEGAPQPREIVVEERTWYVFKDPGALWFPSAVWTGISLVLFALSLFALDRLEQREKREAAEAEQPSDAPVTVAQ